MNLPRNIRRFYFHRHHDQSGVSGTGDVAEGVIFSDGRCSLRFISPTGSTSNWDSIEHIKAVHGHGGSTEIVFIDPDPNPVTEAPTSAEPEPEKITKKRKKVQKAEQ